MLHFRKKNSTLHRRHSRRQRRLLCVKITINVEEAEESPETISTIECQPPPSLLSSSLTVSINALFIIHQLRVRVLSLRGRAVPAIQLTSVKNYLDSHKQTYMIRFNHSKQKSTGKLILLGSRL